MIDISEKIGLSIGFGIENSKMEFGNDVIFKKYWKKTITGSTIPGEPLWKSLKLAIDFTDEKGNIIKQPDLADYEKKELYWGYNEVFFNKEKQLRLIEQNNLRPDITIIPQGIIGEEYIRTEGHEHLSELPEVYETVLGKNIYLLFKKKLNSEDIEDVIAVFAEEGDHVLFPPGYQHVSINIGNAPLVIADWVSTKANPDFMFIKKHNGPPYWTVKSKKGVEFIKNSRYAGKVPEIRIVKPTKEIAEFGLKKGAPMFNLIKDGKINMLDFLNDSTKKYDSVYKKAFYRIG